GHFGELNLTFDRGPHTGRERADLPHSCAILVTQGQQEQQILHLRDAKSPELLRESRANTAQGGDWPLLARCAHNTSCGSFSQGTKRTRPRPAHPAEVAPRRRRHAQGKAECNSSP